MTDLAERVDTIERGYEYLLAYAAQGRRDDAGSEVRATLTAMYTALDGLSTATKEAFEKVALGATEATGKDAAAFIEAVAEDARKARSAVALVLTRPAISSLLVDNLNASIHLRALLTDVFLVEQALKS